MSDDTRTADLLTECVAELATPADRGRRRALSLLQEIEALAPGVVEQMAARLQLRRLRPTAGH